MTGVPVPAKATQPTIRAFSPSSRREEVDSRIREFIVSNGLQPGDRLPGEAWFAEQLGVGRPLIREALRGMEALGIVETRKGVGRFVGAFELGAYLQQFPTEVLLQSFSERELEETRCLLEIAAVAGAVERLSDDDLREVERLMQDMRHAVARGEDITESDLGLHRLIMNRVDNRISAALLDAIFALAVARDEQGPRDRAKIEHDLREHEAIAAAALRRDGNAARQALIAHFETTAGRLGFNPIWRELYGDTERAALMIER
jgi:DNA-binding FadR family transcriptional regulator